MNTRNHRDALRLWIIGATSVLGLTLAACGEQTAEEQGAAPTTEQQSENTTTQ